MFTIDKDNDYRFGKRNGENTICKKDIVACMTSVTNALLCTNRKLPNVVFELLANLVGEPAIIH